MTALHLAKPQDAERLLPLVSGFHADMGISQDPERRSRALAPLLEGSPHGAVYLIGPAKAPLGYIVVSFGWSIELGGMDGFIDEFFIRKSVRGRGIGTEVLHNLMKALAGAGLMALHLEVRGDAGKTQRLYETSGFKPRDGYLLMTCEIQ